MMDPLIQNALKNKPDYSKNFSEKVASVGKKLSEEFDFPVFHDADMNYSNGQKLQIYFDVNGEPTQRGNDKAKYYITVLVSSLGELFTMTTRRLEFSEYLKKDWWMLVDKSELPSKVIGSFDEIKELVQKLGYGYVEGEVLDKETKFLSQLDEGRKLSVNEALFGEI